MAPLLSDLVRQVLSDVNRTDITASAAVVTAINYYKKQRWWFQEVVDTMSLSASQAYYPVPAGFLKMDNMMIWVSGSKQPVDPTTYEDIDNRDDGTFFSTPEAFAVYQDQIRFYPPPEKAYTVSRSYSVQLDAPTASGSNSWTTAGFDLIRHRAAWDLQAHRIRDYEGAADAKNAEQEAYMNLMRENTLRISGGVVKRGF